MTSSDLPLARRSDVAPGTTHRVQRDGEAILLCNVDGTFYAIEDECTHDGGELDQGELEGCKIMCPRHGAYFDVTTGAALTMPAVLPVRTFAVRLDGDDIYLA
ncbi:MAG: non-heme iron oxygenase ferredoxin subunit [Candidatus Eremiobacteraeota bacterium]|nr:non-heme iron oxygenase ferredoxin subunit [Candidatus Eremiobacteraeota bacterium]